MSKLSKSENLLKWRQFSQQLINSKTIETKYLKRYQLIALTLLCCIKQKKINGRFPKYLTKYIIRLNVPIKNIERVTFKRKYNYEIELYEPFNGDICKLVEIENAFYIYIRHKTSCLMYELKNINIASNEIKIVYKWTKFSENLLDLLENGNELCIEKITKKGILFIDNNDYKCIICKSRDNPVINSYHAINPRRFYCKKCCHNIISRDINQNNQMFKTISNCINNRNERMYVKCNIVPDYDHQYYHTVHVPNFDESECLGYSEDNTLYFNQLNSKYIFENIVKCRVCKKIRLGYSDHDPNYKLEYCLLCANKEFASQEKIYQLNNARVVFCNKLKCDHVIYFRKYI